MKVLDKASVEASLASWVGHIQLPGMASALASSVVQGSSLGVPWGLPLAPEVGCIQLLFRKVLVSFDRSSGRVVGFG